MMCFCASITKVLNFPTRPAFTIILLLKSRRSGAAITHTSSRYLSMARAMICSTAFPCCRRRKRRWQHCSRVSIIVCSRSRW